MDDNIIDLTNTSDEEAGSAEREDNEANIDLVMVEDGVGDILWMHRINGRVVDNSDLSIELHRAPVICCAQHPNRALDWIATGSEDTNIMIWRCSDNAVIKMITDHDYAVTNITFHAKGKYMASADSSGQIIVYRILPHSSHKFTNIWTRKVSSLLWMIWHPTLSFLTASGGDSIIRKWMPPTTQFKTLSGDTNPCISGIYSKDGVYLVTGYVGGCVRIWKNSNDAIVFCVYFKSPLTKKPPTKMMLAANPKGNNFVLTDNNGTLIFFNMEGTRTKYVIGNDTISSMEFSPEMDLLATVTVRGLVYLWDTETYMLVKRTGRLPGRRNGYTKVKWLNNRILLASSVLGSVYGINARSGQCIYHFVGHKKRIYDFVCCEETSLVLTISADHTIKIFTVPVLPAEAA